MYLSKSLYILTGKGYIAGSNNGIVTVDNAPAARGVYLLDADTLTTISSTQSLDDGHYLFTGLDAQKKYLVIARDYKGEYESVAWDYVKPATDLTIAEQQELWRSWQTT